LQGCDDGIDCTINDMESVLPDGTVCEPCLGEFLDCSIEGETQAIPCDDNNDNTVDDIEIILTCDGSICLSCRGVAVEQKVYMVNTIELNGPDNTFKLYSRDPIMIDVFSIYDRWGNQIHSATKVLSDDPSAEWKGRRNGQEVNQGVYIYYIEYQVGGEVIKSVGNLTLIR